MENDNMTYEKDIILIYFEDEPFSFARIEEISADVKPNWFFVKLLLLQIPVQVVTWILRDVYIDGEEFTMNGKRIRFEKITCPEEMLPDETGESEEIGKIDESDKKQDSEGKGKNNVISFKDLKKS